MGDMWCFTSTSPATSTSIATATAPQKRDSGGTQSPMATATVYLDHLVFAKAGVVAKDSGKETGNSNAVPLGIVGAILVSVWGGTLLLENGFM